MSGRRDEDYKTWDKEDLIQVAIATLYIQLKHLLQSTKCNGYIERRRPFYSHHSNCSNINIALNVSPRSDDPSTSQ